MARFTSHARAKEQVERWAPRWSRPYPIEVLREDGETWLCLRVPCWINRGGIAARSTQLNKVVLLDDKTTLQGVLRFRRQRHERDLLKKAREANQRRREAISRFFEPKLHELRGDILKATRQLGTEELRRAIWETLYGPHAR